MAFLDRPSPAPQTPVLLPARHAPHHRGTHPHPPVRPVRATHARIRRRHPVVAPPIHPRPQGAHEPHQRRHLRADRLVDHHAHQGNQTPAPGDTAPTRTTCAESYPLIKPATPLTSARKALGNDRGRGQSTSPSATAQPAAPSTSASIEMPTKFNGASPPPLFVVPQGRPVSKVEHTVRLPVDGAPSRQLGHPRGRSRHADHLPKQVG